MRAAQVDRCVNQTHLEHRGHPQMQSVGGYCCDDDGGGGGGGGPG